MPSNINSEKVFSSFLNVIEKHVATFGDGLNIPFFRGCSDDTFKLIPSLFRNEEKIKHNLDFDGLENNIFYEFSANIEGLKNENSDWSILFRMQHHGFPTRLLDWTENLGVALYFALKFSYENNHSSPCIWVLDPFELNNSKNEIKQNKYTNIKGDTLYNPDRDFKYNYYDSFIVWTVNELNLFKLPKALYPVKSNERVRAQKAVFTVHGSEIKCISELAPKAVKKFNIPLKAIPAALKFLDRFAINHFSMFPDYEGLRRQMIEEYYK